LEHWDDAGGHDCSASYWTIDGSSCTVSKQKKVSEHVHHRKMPLLLLRYMPSTMVTSLTPVPAMHIFS